MKMMLSMPRTISSTVRVRSAIQVSGEVSQGITKRTSSSRRRQTTTSSRTVDHGLARRFCATVLRDVFARRRFALAKLAAAYSPTALQGSCDPGVFILGRVSHLDAFSGYPRATSLTGVALGRTAGTREVASSGSSRTTDDIPQHSNAHTGYRPNCLTTF